MIFGQEKRARNRLRRRDVAAGRRCDDPAVLVHDETNVMLAHMLSLMESTPGLPTPLGIFRAVDRPTYERQLNDQVEAQKKIKTLTIQQVLESGETWIVE